MNILVLPQISLEDTFPSGKQLKLACMAGTHRVNEGSRERGGTSSGDPGFPLILPLYILANVALTVKKMIDYLMT